MTQPIGEKTIQQKTILSLSNNLQNNKPQPTITINQSNIPSIFRHLEKSIVLFAYKPELHEDPPHQIMVMQQPKKKHKMTGQEKIAEMFGNFNLQGTTQKLFLTKIDTHEHKEIKKEIEQMLQVSNNYSRRDRQERRKQIFEAQRARQTSRDYASEEVMAKRKIRVVKMDSLIQGGTIKGVVQLGGKPVQYEDLNLITQNQNYYALIRKKVNVDQIFPQVNIQQKYLNNIQFEVQCNQQKYENEDQYDSNDSQNSAFDYPEEQNSRSSEEIIRDHDQMDQYYQNAQDEEELYRKYLRRERRKEQRMEEQQVFQYQEYD